MRPILLRLLPLLAVLGTAHALPPATITLPTPVAAVDAGIDPNTKMHAFNLGLRWFESSRHFSFAVSNTSASALSVIGVEGSSGIYMTSTPSTIPAQGSATFTTLLMSKMGSVQSSSIIRILTTTGEIPIQINHTRESAVQFSTTHLKWTVGSAATAQTVTFTISPNAAIPIAVTATGTGNTAKLTHGNGVTYTITVTPSSTAKASTFQVAVAFQPNLPGISSAIACEISP